MFWRALCRSSCTPLAHREKLGRGLLQSSAAGFWTVLAESALPCPVPCHVLSRLP